MFSFVTDSPGNAIPDRSMSEKLKFESIIGYFYSIDDVDGTPFSTMKFGSDTLDEEPKKEEFFRVKLSLRKSA